MKSVNQNQFVLLSWCSLTIIFLFWSCKRDIPLPPAETTGTHTVNFKLSGFESSIKPLSKAQAAMGVSFPHHGMDALLNVTPGLEEQYLYYWSFNAETLVPDVAVDELGAAITFEAKDSEADFGSGFAVSPYDAGRALSLVGAKQLELLIPMMGIESLTTFEFDISSSNTGPKSFSLFYSINGGATYETLNLDNQFQNMGAQAKNQYTFDLSDSIKFIGIASLKLKFEFLEGDRGNTGGYSLTSGVVKLDNIRLSGVYNGEPTANPVGPDKLRYYVFSAADGSVVGQKEMAMSELDGGNLAVALDAGTYDVLFLAYRTADEMLLPQSLTSSSAFYFGQHFNDRDAITFAALLADVEVDDADVNASVMLERCYSLVEFSFDDHWANLSAVKKIQVTRLHENFLYAPFGSSFTPPVSDAETITFDGLSTASDYDLAFHQFLGLPIAARAVSYRLVAYDAGGTVLKTVTIGESVPNNVILRFTGQLTGPALPDKFAVQIKTDWDDTIERTF